jgi:hypothetical protein
MKGPSRSLLRYRPSCGKRQPAAPELPGTIAKPTRFGPKHDFDQTVLTNRLLQNNDVVKGAQVHHLGDDTVFGRRFIAHWVPPKVFPTKFSNGLRSDVISFHGLIITYSASEWIAFFIPSSCQTGQAQTVAIAMTDCANLPRQSRHVTVKTTIDYVFLSRTYAQGQSTIGSNGADSHLRSG